MPTKDVIQFDHESDGVIYAGGDFRKYLLPLESFGGLTHYTRIATKHPGIAISIVANGLGYCYPRQTLPLYEYEALEVAITKRGEITSSKKHLNDFPYLETFSDSCGIYSYVPIAVIQALVEFLNT